MGRLLETSKRRPVQESGVRNQESEVSPSPARPATAASPPPAPESDWPFIEVPETHPRATSTAAPSADKRPPQAAQVNGSAQPPVVSFQRRQPSPADAISSFGTELMVGREPGSAAAMQYRQVAENLRTALKAENLRSLLLLPLDAATSPAPTAVNLALALAEAGATILLIDAGRSVRPTSEMLGLAAAPGWAEVVQGMLPAHAIQDSGWHRLHVLAAGNRLAGSTSPLHGDKMGGLLDDLRSRYDLLLLLAPSHATGGLSALLPHLCDAVCLLLDKKQVDQPAEANCLKTLRSERVRVLGSIVTHHGSGA